MTALAADTRSRLRFVSAYAQITFRNMLAYRVDLFVKLAGYPARLLMAYFLWRALIGTGVIQGRSFQTVISYYLVTYLLTQMYPFVRMAREIRAEIFSGDVLVFMARGVPHWAVWVGRFLATACAYLLLVAPLAAVMIAFVGRVVLTLQAVGGFIALLLIGTMIKGQLWYLIGMSSLFTEENIGTIRIYELVEQFLSGAILPLFVFPAGFGAVAPYLPFTYMVYAPVQVLVEGSSWAALGQQLAIGMCWCMALGFLTRIVTSAGWRRFTAHGA